MATASHPIDVRSGNKYSDEHDHEEHDKVLTSVAHEKAFVIPFVIGSIVTLSWMINNLVIQFYVQNDLSKNAASSNVLLNTVYHLSSISFVIQASTFAAGTAFAYYATQTQSGLYYLLSTVFNFIVVCVWFIYVVEPFGFMQWRHSSSLTGNTPFGTCFFKDPRPASYNSDLCNAFKAASIFSFFLMVTHAIWTITHLMRAVRTSAFRLTAGASGFHSLINLFALINIASYIIWLGGRLALADKYNAYDASLVTYILTMSVAAATISSLSFIHNPTAASEFFGLIFNAITSSMFASVVIMLARMSDSSSVVSSLDATLSTDSGKAVVAAEFIMFLSTGITALIFVILRYFK